MPGVLTNPFIYLFKVHLQIITILIPIISNSRAGILYCKYLINVLFCHLVSLVSNSSKYSLNCETKILNMTTEKIHRIQYFVTSWTRNYNMYYCTLSTVLKTKPFQNSFSGVNEIQVLCTLCQKIKFPFCIGFI